MKKIIALFFLVTLSCVSKRAFATIDEVARIKFNNIDLSNIQTIDELSDDIKQISSEPKTELEILLLWTEKYMNPDSNRFFNGGPPLSTNESIKQKTGLCDEYCNIVDAFCEKNGIKSLRIEGYVKEAEQTPLQVFKQTNHAWNAVFIDSTWLVCDLLWSTCELRNKVEGLAFNKRLNTDYFLQSPSIFSSTHLPADPLFQFSNTPVNMHSFIASNPEPSNETYSYTDSLANFLSLNKQDRLLQIAKNSYQFNNENSSMLIETYYNYAIDVYNNPKSKRLQLQKAIACLNTALTLINTTEVPSIKDLAPSMFQALASLNLRLDYNKKHKI